MQKLISALKRLGFVDAIMWGQMILTVRVFTACSSMQEHEVIINRGDREAQEITVYSQVKIGDHVRHEGLNWLVVETELTTDNLQLMAEEEREFNETYPKD